MKFKIRPIKLKIIAVLIIDTFLFFFLLLAGYTLFFIPAKAENAEMTVALTQNQVFDPMMVFCGNSTPCPTKTITPSPTDTIEPSPTDTLEPSPTDTIEPSPTDTIEPSPTDTIEPSPTDTVEPSPTNTLEPSPTDTSEPSPTSTLEPSPTNTLEPSPTSTTVPSPTSTANIPIPSDTPMPTAAQTSTSIPHWTPSPTSPKPQYTSTPIPSPTYTAVTQTPSVTPTSEAINCTICYIVKDFRELIVSGLYSADILNTENMSSTFNVSITLYNEYKGVVIGKTINMVDKQSANKVLHVETPLWCISPAVGDEYWIHTTATVQNESGKLWFEKDEWVRIDPQNAIVTLP